MADYRFLCRGVATVLFAAFALATVSPSALRAQQSSQTANIPHYDKAAFAAWLDAFKREALAEGISQDVLDRAFAGVEPLAKVLEYDRRQPEFTRTFAAYLESAISEKRIATGRKLLAEHGALLRQVRERYRVQPRFLIAFWGLETNYGGYTGGFSVIEALTTLAFDPRRSEFFRAQLIEALRILQDGHIAPQAMTGSWAGAMGQLQFMPSTFTGFAIDGDGDGKRDIWENLPDVFASAAHYLKSEGWRGDETWGREVILPDGFDLQVANSGMRKPISDWQALGVRRGNGGDLPTADIEGAIVLPAGHRGPAFLVYQNFSTTLQWNRSTFYAIAIGILADRIAGKPGLRHPPDPKEPRLHRSEVAVMQNRLIAAGLDPGGIDGVIGRNTRKALKAFQSAAGLPPDGYPDAMTLAKLRALYP